MKIKIRIVKIFIGVILIFIVLFHILWFYNYTTYEPYMKAVGIGEYGGYTYTDDVLTYAAFPPRYPQFTGNLSICDIYRYGEMQEGDVLVDMIIWPSINGEFTVGLTIKIVKSTNEQEGIYNLDTISFSYELDENKNFLNDYTEEELQYYYDYEYIINTFYEKAYKMWGILGET